MTDNTTLNSLFTSSGFSAKQKEDFLSSLDAQLQSDNHDLALEEKMEIIGTCFKRNINSVVMAIPDVDELYLYKKCVRKYARVKMRAVTYYHKDLHAQDGERGEYLLKNLAAMRALMRVEE